MVHGYTHTHTHKIDSTILLTYSQSGNNLFRLGLANPSAHPSNKPVNPIACANLAGGDSSSAMPHASNAVGIPTEAPKTNLALRGFLVLLLLLLEVEEGD